MSISLHQRTTATVVAGIIALSQTIVPAAHAQSDANEPAAIDEQLDSEPPLLDHSVIPTGNAGDAQVFLATVSDERELGDVTLFYRYKGEERFASLPMTPIDDSDNYSASLGTSADETRPIEYYIEATDAADNRVVQGFVFEPLVRELQPPPQAVGTSSDPAEDASNGMSTGRKILYVVLGVLVVGGIAAALDSGDDDDSSSGGGTGGGDSGGDDSSGGTDGATDAGGADDGGGDDAGSADAGAGDGSGDDGAGDAGAGGDSTAGDDGAVDATGGDDGSDTAAEAGDTTETAPVAAGAGGDIGTGSAGSGLRLGITF